MSRKPAAPTPAPTQPKVEITEAGTLMVDWIEKRCMMDPGDPCTLRCAMFTTTKQVSGRYTVELACGRERLRYEDVEDKFFTNLNELAE